jgi:hypothetical protein
MAAFKLASARVAKNLLPALSKICTGSPSAFIRSLVFNLQYLSTSCVLVKERARAHEAQEARWSVPAHGFGSFLDLVELFSILLCSVLQQQLELHQCHCCPGADDTLLKGKQCQHLTECSSMWTGHH